MNMLIDAFPKCKYPFQVLSATVNSLLSFGWHCLLCDNSVLQTTFDRPLIAYYAHRCRGPITVIVMNKNTSLMPLSTLEVHKWRTKRGTIEKRLTSCEPISRHRLIRLISVPLYPNSVGSFLLTCFWTITGYVMLGILKILGLLLIIAIILTAWFVD